MLKTIKRILLDLVSNIDSGNSNISEEEALLWVKVLLTYTDKSIKLSKYLACLLLNCSRASFDNYVKGGLISQGKKEAGFKEKFWIKKDIEALIKNSNV